ncbi:MAG: OprO/OprP family phosphate-selective porin [Opitutales bacterium]|nr:OprO/OprP family phosphate-selective porin [Opitutales bacterium]
MKLNKLTQLTAVSMALLGASSFAASNDALLDLLVKKGVLSETEATAVAAELKEENKGVSFSAKGKETVKLRFNGRMQAQYDALSGEDNGVDNPSTNHFYFRRLFLGAKANLANGVYAETVLDFARDGDGGDNYGVNFDKASFGYKFDEKLDAQLGFQTVPFGFEETTSSSSLQTIERSAVNRFFADDIDFSSRHMGLHAQGDLAGGFSYAVALVNSAQGEGSRLLGDSNTSNDMAFFGRAQWESNGFTVGVDGGSQSNNSVVGGSDVTAFTGYVNYKFEGLNLLAEYFTADMDAAEDAEGYSLRASYKFGKFEPVVRFAHLETDSFVIDTDELIRRAPLGGSVTGTNNEIDSFYLGVNYYYSPAVTFLAGYENAKAENGAGTDEAKVDGFRARVQVLW